MDPIWVVLISTVFPALIVLAGRLIDKRRGIPAEIDGAIDSHVQFVVEALKEEVAQRKEASEECNRQLVAARAERETDRDAFDARIATLEHDKDRLEAQVNRLLLKIDGGTP